MSSDFHLCHEAWGRYLIVCWLLPWHQRAIATTGGSYSCCHTSYCYWAQYPSPAQHIVAFIRFLSLLLLVPPHYTSTTNSSFVLVYYHDSTHYIPSMPLLLAVLPAPVWQSTSINLYQPSILSLSLSSSAITIPWLLVLVSNFGFGCKILCHSILVLSHKIEIVLLVQIHDPSKLLLRLRLRLRLRQRLRLRMQTLRKIS